MLLERDNNTYSEDFRVGPRVQRSTPGQINYDSLLGLETLFTLLLVRHCCAQEAVLGCRRTLDFAVVSMIVEGAGVRF